MPPFHGEDNVLFSSNRSTVYARPRRNGFKQIKFKFRSGHRTTIILRPPLTDPLTITRQMMATYCQIIIASDPNVHSRQAHIYAKDVRKRNPQPLHRRFKVAECLHSEGAGERIKQILLLSDGQTGMTAMCEKECLHREEHPVKQTLSVRSHFITHARNDFSWFPLR